MGSSLQSWIESVAIDARSWADKIAGCEVKTRPEFAGEGGRINLSPPDPVILVSGLGPWPDRPTLPSQQ